MTEQATVHTSSTMNLHECCEALRANLISISESKLGEAIMTGKLPFGFGVPGKKSTYVIFRHAFYAWLDNNLGEEAIRI